MKYWEIILTDEDGGSSTVKSADIAGTIGLFDINAPAAGTYYFYVDWAGRESFKFEKFSLTKFGGGDMHCNIEWKVGNDFIIGGLSEGYDTDAYLNFDATQAARWNTIDIEQVCYGVPIRISCTVSAAGIIRAQALRS